MEVSPLKLSKQNKTKPRVLFEIGAIAYLCADRIDPESREIFLK